MTVNTATTPKLILVVGKDVTQAHDLWKGLGLREKYPSEARVKYVSRNSSMLDGHDPFSMLIILVGQYWLNPIMESSVINHYMKFGATVVKEGLH
ncbi:hypothetical protein BSK66_25580 [Paenibacillus odorifer]|uniref:hypothetical protein n=1 Tax=Paenibacillus TaxID=44249 RepID=UPI0003E20B1E|nr:MULTISPECIES: hypothetical protein [Paenibacillus]ETT46287.1 hypothetical protein C171_28567 [Paenibacillus sp. FSL H8-237]OME50213.1 hypothetical protein BSK66_25580 [Paenibacillus odorifer]